MLCLHLLDSDDKTGRPQAIRSYYLFETDRSAHTEELISGFFITHLFPNFLLKVFFSDSWRARTAAATTAEELLAKARPVIQHTQGLN